MTAEEHPARAAEDGRGPPTRLTAGGRSQCRAAGSRWRAGRLRPPDWRPTSRSFGRRGAEGRPDDETGRERRLTLARTALAERTLDLQRLQAEYVNYKRRVDRDRDLVKQNATFGVLWRAARRVLDDIDRAREHGELEGGFKAVADSLERIVTRWA